jgi:hypothetical protein
MNPEAMALAPKTRMVFVHIHRIPRGIVLCGRDFDFLAADSVLEIYGHVVIGNQIL